MKQSLQLRVGQQLAMTPQLQQAIRFLQMSTLELKQEIQTTLDSNFMLEEGDEHSADEESNSLEQEPDTSSDIAEEPLSTETLQDNIPEELPVDSSWDDVYEPSVQPTSHSASTEAPELENQDFSYTSLNAHLNAQIDLFPLSETDYAIAVALIDAITPEGFLGISTEEIYQQLTADMAEDEEFSAQEVDTVLTLIQHLEPVGVGARDLQECLLIQLNHLDHDTDYRKEAIHLITQHFKLLGSRDYNQLIRQMNVNKAELEQIITLIQTLNPRPGNCVESAQTEYIVPEVFVRKVNQRWRVSLNTDVVPSLRVNSTYQNLIKSVTNSNDSQTMKAHMQEARWFIKSLQSRSETLLKVSRSIVEHQQAFLEQGEEAMKSMVLRDVAEQLDMHESTISRVTTRKFMHTPRGIFELKYFFSSHISNPDGKDISATAIRAQIKKLISTEPPNKPLSDNKIMQLLAEKNISIARRTVAKYRESLRILPSSERKRMI